MILLFAVVVAFVVSLVTGGRPERLARVSIRWAWLAPLVFAAQAYLIYYPASRAEGLLSIRALVMVISYGLLIPLMWVNRCLPGMKLIALGLALNFTVMLANGGYMPITREALTQSGLAHLILGEQPGARVLNTKDVLLPRDATRLWWLSDIFVIPPSAPISGVFSVGDVVIAAGAFWFLYKHMHASTDALWRKEPA